jgi:ElaA protein
MGKVRFDVVPFDELSAHDFHDIAWLRNVVFVVGQKITEEPEIDGRDPECVHARLFEDDRLVGTARIFASADPIVVGRVAVHTDLQRSGLGTQLMLGVQEFIGARRAELHAQAHLEEWYTRLGWERFGEPFDEANISHVMMRWPATDG